MIVISISLFIIGVEFRLLKLTYFYEWEIISLNSIEVIIRVLLDYKSLLFMGLVIFISSLVILYRNTYIFGDINIDRFVILVLMFVLSIIFLIIRPNLIRILLGWDGLGLVSYCLVIYYQNVSSYRAGILTALRNRVGDVALLIRIAWIVYVGGWNYIFYLDNKRLEMYIITIIVILAAITKRAQIPFSSWLPAAIAAPTPVSALVHSSTLVTAGVYLLIRFYELIDLIGFKSFVFFIGCLTIFIAGVGANLEFDLKKVIAISTLRQLGLIITTIGIGFPELAFFHLLTHAIFKALLFLCAGVIIHNLNNLQDVRGIGCLVNQMPFTSICFNISNLALCGMPFLAGFYSKDLILETYLIRNWNLLMFLLIFISTGLTVRYTFRLIYYTIRGDFNYFVIHSLGDDEWGIIYPIIIITLISIVGGRIIRWIILESPTIICLGNWEKFLVMGVRLIGGVLGYELSRIEDFTRWILFKNYKVTNFLGSIWYIPYLSTHFVNVFFLNIGLFYHKNFDGGWMEELGGQGLYNYFKEKSIQIQFFQLRNFKVYLISFFLWVILLFIVIYFYLNSL